MLHVLRLEQATKHMTVGCVGRYLQQPAACIGTGIMQASGVLSSVHRIAPEM